MKTSSNFYVPPKTKLVSGEKKKTMDEELADLLEKDVCSSVLSLLLLALVCDSV